ncbi:MAG: helix-turn-helix domain-containing protein [Defluviitaleaceae bacterium]|nr:helix-turn-helix domain-containing protein [Defluviitaleaceae bacterium]
MDNEILNLEQAMELFGVSERTMIKLLREENVPARKIGREWRFSKTALLRWLGEGNSASYNTHADEAEPRDITKTNKTGCLPCCPELRRVR